MTREEALQLLENRFSPRIANRQQALTTAQAELDLVIGTKEEKRKEINAYFDALADKPRIDSILAAGEPVVN